MAIEPRRGCGYRKVGGLYLCSDNAGGPCCRLPLLLTVCPTCNAGIKQTRTFQWIDPRPWFADGACTASKGQELHCPVARGGLGERVGLMWVGEQFYKTPAHFQREAMDLGISRRIAGVPRGLELGVTWVLLCHPKVCSALDVETGKLVWTPGIFRIMRPTRIDKIVLASEAADAAAMAKLTEAGITPVVVPDDDKDHQGSVYDREDDEPLLV